MTAAGPSPLPEVKTLRSRGDVTKRSRIEALKAHVTKLLAK